MYAREIWFYIIIILKQTLWRAIQESLMIYERIELVTNVTDKLLGLFAAAYFDLRGCP